MGLAVKGYGYAVKSIYLVGQQEVGRCIGVLEDDQFEVLKGSIPKQYTNQQVNVIPSEELELVLADFR